MHSGKAIPSCVPLPRYWVTRLRWARRQAAHNPPRSIPWNCRASSRRALELFARPPMAYGYPARGPTPLHQSAPYYLGPLKSPLYSHLEVSSFSRDTSEYFQALNKEYLILAELGSEERSASSMRGYGMDPFGSIPGSGEQPKIFLGWTVPGGTSQRTSYPVQS
jgi:hypothetical protein